MRLDRNFVVQNKVSCEQFTFYDVEDSPFRIYGLIRDGERFCRMPKTVAEQVSAPVETHYLHTSGGRVRFVTDSSEIVIRAEMDHIIRNPHMTLTGSAGFDFYMEKNNRQVYQGTFVPPYRMEAGYESRMHLQETGEKEITIYFPLYSGVKKLFIGLEQQAVVKEAPDYRVETPIVFYGSSITQGGCASRPGNSYESILSRRLSANYWNLGFSDGARGEEMMAEYLAGLQMSMLVCDYDHNSDYDTLKERHPLLYKKVRERQPELPILFLSAPDALSQHAKEERLADRREVVRMTYQTAVNEGDRHVSFVDGEELFVGEDWDSCTVDGRHPNDLGFYRMAKRIEKEIQYVI